MREEIEKILAEYFGQDGVYTWVSRKGTNDHPAAQLDSLFRTKMLELIGEDPEGDSHTDPSKCNHSCHVISERLLKHELRSKLGLQNGN
jgi:hypothetical protein